MRLTVLAAAAALALATPAGAAKKHKYTGVQLAMTIACAVMPGETCNVVNATARHLFVDVKGARYFFHCKRCLAMFKHHRKDYLDGAHMPVKDAPK